jgi:cobalamin transport system ATP-binding protein
MLQVRNIEFSYTRPVLKGLSFELGSRELLAVLGPNGSGKSTLLKMLVRLLEPSSGELLMDGRRLSSMTRRETSRLIGYVPQESVISFPLTAMEFVLQGRFAQGGLIGFESNDDVSAARWAMELTETSHFAARRVRELSGGERQRVMLARALASKPRYLILDEPVANLDISHQVRMLELLGSLTKDLEMSAVLVTHELNLAAEFATRVLFLKAGELIAVGDPREVMTEARLQQVFETEVLVDEHPLSRAPRITLVTVARQGPNEALAPTSEQELNARSWKGSKRSKIG